MKLYAIYYAANEYDDLAYDAPIPIYYSLDKDKAKTYYNNITISEKNYFNQFLKDHPKFQNDENYSIDSDTENSFEYCMGKWIYKYYFHEIPLEVDLRYDND